MSVNFENVYFSYGNKRVFDNFSVSISSGSKIALMGASGSGKTTFLKLAAGLLNPSGGTVSVAENGAAFVFQESRLVPHLTVTENITLVSPGANPSVLLEELGLGEEQNSLPASLSGGMARRVALVRALVYRAAELLLLDEPFSGLDDTTREKTAVCILKHAAGRTIIAATHDDKEAALLGAEILRL